MAVSEAQKRATAKSRKKIYDQITYVVRFDAELNGDAIRAHAAKMNESLNGFLKRAVEETIARDHTREYNKRALTEYAQLIRKD